MKYLTQTNLEIITQWKIFHVKNIDFFYNLDHRKSSDDRSRTCKNSQFQEEKVQKSQFLVNLFPMLNERNFPNMIVNNRFYDDMLIMCDTHQFYNPYLPQN